MMLTICGCLLPAGLYGQAPDKPLVPAKSEGTLRLATFNVSLNRKKPGELKESLAKNDKQVQAIAAVIRVVRPDVLLVNELDYDSAADNAAGLAARLADAQPDIAGGTAWSMPHQYSAPVNTGAPAVWTSMAMAN